MVCNVIIKNVVNHIVENLKVFYMLHAQRAYTEHRGHQYTSTIKFHIALQGGKWILVTSLEITASAGITVVSTKERKLNCPQVSQTRTYMSLPNSQTNRWECLDICTPQAKKTAQ